MWPRTPPLLLVLACLGGCHAPRPRTPTTQANRDSPSPPPVPPQKTDFARWQAEWEARRTTYGNMDAVASAAYMFEGDRRTATLETMIERSDDQYAIAARGRTHDAWGHVLRLHYSSARRSPWDVVISSGGLDGVFGTEDDLRMNTRSWQ